MPHKLNLHCVQLDEIVNLETYVDLMLEGYLPLQDVQKSDATEPSHEK